MGTQAPEGPIRIASLLLIDNDAHMAFYASAFRHMVSLHKFRAIADNARQLPVAWFDRTLGKHSDKI